MSFPRSHAEEAMDDPALPAETYAAVLRDLAQVNVVTMAARPTLAFLDSIVGRGDRLKLLDLTNCTFDGHMYNVRRVMEECLAIKPDLIFLWDEAWSGFARFSPFLRPRTAMGAAADIEDWLRDPASISAYEKQRADLGICQQRRHLQQPARRIVVQPLDEPHPVRATTHLPEGLKER